MTGRVVEADGSPVEGALIRIAPRDDPNSQFMRLERPFDPFDDLEPGAVDGTRSDADGEFELPVCATTARFGFGHQLEVYTLDGRVERPAAPRVISRERADQLVLQLAPVRWLELRVTSALSLNELDRDRFIDPSAEPDLPHSRGGVGVPITWTDSIDRRYEGWAQRVSGDSLLVALDPQLDVPVRVELNLPGHEPTAADVTRVDDGRYRAEISPEPYRVVTLALQAQAEVRTSGSIRLTATGLRVESEDVQRRVWKRSFNVDLGRLPVAVSLSLGPDPIDRLRVHGTDSDGDEQVLAEFDPQVQTVIPVVLPELAALPPERHDLPLSDFDVGAESALVLATVIDASTGRPLFRAAPVELDTTGTTITKQVGAQSDRAGRLIAAGIAPGTPTVLGIAARYFELERIELPALAAGERHDLGTVALTPSRVAVRLRVLDHNGQPVPDLKVKLARSSGTTDASGRIDFPKPRGVGGKIDDDRYVVVLGDELKQWRVVDLSSDEMIEIRLRPIRSVELRLSGRARLTRGLAPADIGPLPHGYWQRLGRDSRGNPSLGEALDTAPEGERWYLIELPVGDYSLNRANQPETHDFRVVAGSGRQLVEFGDE